jgi:formylglycine-generating enzyme required for sulfatase activity
MRPLGPFALAALVCFAADLDAAPPRPRHPGPAPAPAAVEGSTREGVVLLRTPGPEQVLLRAGAFTMGSDDGDFADAMSLCRLEPRRDDCKEVWFTAEQPAHQVYLADYWIDRREVSVARYRACVNAGACVAPPYGEGGERFDRPELPVSLVTWNDARHFCEWTGGRLPTEAEWERAARGLDPKEAVPDGGHPHAPDAIHPRDDDSLPKGRRYPWGNVYNPFLSNHGAWALDDLDARDGFLELAPVGSFPDGRTPEGLEDMAGNVQEWVSDWFAPEYPRADAVNPKGPDAGDRRVVRGGSYLHARAWLRGAARDKEGPGERAPWIGFRCARDG